MYVCKEMVLIISPSMYVAIYCITEKYNKQKIHTMFKFNYIHEKI